MRVWVVKTSEMLAGDNGNGRVLRSGIVAQMLEKRGHDVTWWMSTFDHANRRNRAQHDLSVPFGERGCIRMIFSPGYKASISLARVYDHVIWGRAFRTAIRNVPQPDIIFCAYPTIEAAAECVRFARKHSVPVVLDVRDMWPHIFAEIAPVALKRIAHFMLQPWRARARGALRGASALFAISEEFLAWALTVAGRGRRSWDAAFRLAYPLPSLAEPRDLSPARAAGFWDSRGIFRSGSFNIVFVGSITRRRLEMEAVLHAARNLSRGATAVKFIFAGDGDDLPAYRAQARDCGNVIFPGWLDVAQIRELLSRAHCGLVPYRNAPDLIMSVPNKVGEYLAAALPVVTCLRGTLSRLLCERQCGLLFDATDPASLEVAVRQLHDDENLRLTLGANGQRAYRDELAAETVYGHLIERLEAIVHAGSARTTVGTDSEPFQSAYE